MPSEGGSRSQPQLRKSRSLESIRSEKRSLSSDGNRNLFTHQRSRSFDDLKLTGSGEHSSNGQTERTGHTSLTNEFSNLFLSLDYQKQATSGDHHVDEHLVNIGESKQRDLVLDSSKSVKIDTRDVMNQSESRDGSKSTTTMDSSIRNDVQEQKKQAPVNLIEKVWKPIRETHEGELSISQQYNMLKSLAKLTDLQRPPEIEYVQGQESDHNPEQQEQELSASDNTELGGIEKSLKVANLKLDEFKNKAREIIRKDTPSCYTPEFKEQLKELQDLRNNANGLISEILSISSPDEVSDDLSLSEMEKSVYDFQKDHLTEQVRLWTEKIDTVIEVKTQYFNSNRQESYSLIEGALRIPSDGVRWNNLKDDLRLMMERMSHDARRDYLQFLERRWEIWQQFNNL